MTLSPSQPTLFPPDTPLRSYASLHQSLDPAGRAILEAMREDLERRGQSRHNAELLAVIRWRAELRARVVRTMQSPR